MDIGENIHSCGGGEALEQLPGEAVGVPSLPSLGVQGQAGWSCEQPVKALTAEGHNTFQGMLELDELQGPNPSCGFTEFLP